MLDHLYDTSKDQKGSDLDSKSESTNREEEQNGLKRSGSAHEVLGLW